jgi:hypothetical protein
MHFSAASFLPVRSKYFCHCPFLEHCQSQLLPQCERPSFTLTGIIYSKFNK